MAKYSFVGRSGEGLRLMWTPFTKKPTSLAVGALQKGDIVKVGVEAQGQRELFWATITERSGQNFKAIVTNDLKLTPLHGLDDESPIEFDAENILQIYAD